MAISFALPRSTLHTHIEGSDTPPVSAALGIEGAWIVPFGDGSRSWDLRNAYPRLTANGKLSNNSNKVIFAALDPYREDCYFVVAQHSACSYNVMFDGKPEAGHLHEITGTDMISREKLDGTTFTHPMTLNGVKKQVRITPNSGAQEGRAKALMATLCARQMPMRKKDLVFVDAVASGVGTLAKAMGSTTINAVGIAASVGFVAALSTWYKNL